MTHPGLAETPDSPLPASSWSTIAAIGLTAVAVKFLLALTVPVTADECLHWLQGRHLAWGFSDHPPGTAALGRLTTALCGDNRLGVRLVPIVGTLACSILAYAMLREAGAGRRRAATGAACVQLLPVIAFGVLMVPTVPHAPLVLAAELALLRALRRGRLVDHIAWGATLGAALLTYYPAAAAVLAGGVFLLRDARGRRALRDPGLWLGDLIAAVVLAPNLVWNLARGTKSAVHFQLAQRHSIDFSPQYFAAFLLLAVTLAGPLLLPAVVRGVRALRAGPADTDDWRPLFASFLLVGLGLFAAVAITTRAGAHWAVLAYLNVPLLLFAPQAEPLLRNWQRSALVVGGALTALVLLVAGVGIERAAKWLPEVDGLLAAERERFLHIGEAADTAHRLADELTLAGHTTELVSNRWSLASLLSFHRAESRGFALLPPADRHGRDFRTWFVRDDTPIELIYVTSTPEVDERVRAASTSVQRLATVGQPTPFAWIHRCSGFVTPAAWR